MSSTLMSQHPLQRMKSPNAGISGLFHALGIMSFASSFVYLANFPSFINDSYGWHFQYLTILGLSIAFLTFVFGFLSDLTLSPKLFVLKNSLALCSAPLEVLISILYWGICAIDSSLVVPPEVDLNPYADIGFHLMPALLLSIDLLFFSPPWTIHAFPAMGLSSVLAFGYWAWVEHCFKHNGWYPYPLFAAMSTPQRAILFGASAVTMTGSTMMLKRLYGRVNGLQGEQKKARPGNVKVE